MNTIVPMTDDEKVVMYNKLSKRELIAILIEANKTIEKVLPVITYPVYPIYRDWINPTTPWITYSTGRTTNDIATFNIEYKD